MYTGDKGFYSAVSIRQQQLRPLVNLFKNAVGFDMPLNPNEDIGLHVTVMYSKSALDVTPEQAIRMNTMVKDLIMKGVVTKFDYWDGHDNEGYLVAKLYSPDLLARHNAYKAAGAKPTFSPYEAHVTITTGPDSRVLAKELAKLNQALSVGPTITLLLLDETIDDLR